jgi:acyl-CoA thioester hydrolase
MLAADSPIPSFHLPIVIRPQDIDEQGHVNNVVYLSWVQDVAIAHWNYLTTLEDRTRYAWVALRHEIDYKAEAVLGDSLVARTWTGIARGMRFPRHTEIIRPIDKKVLCSAMTQWCPLDRSTGRPTRLPTEIAAFFGKSAPIRQAEVSS